MEKIETTSPENNIARHRLDIAFALMDIIPFLVFLYLLAAKLFSIDILMGQTGIILAVTLLLSLVGYTIGYSIVRNLIKQMAKQADEKKEAYVRLSEAQEMIVQAEKLKMAGSFASGVAHEIKNPLAVILQGVHYLEKNIELKADTGAVLKTMKEHVERANNVIHALSIFSSGSDVEMESVDIRPMIESIAGMVISRMPEKKIEAAFDLPEGPIRVVANLILLKEAFNSIFINAVQAMSDGGKLTVRIVREKFGELKGSAGFGMPKGADFKDSDRIIVTEIEDTGVGMSEESLKHAFDLFFSTKGPRQGKGLGLSAAKHIIEMQGGCIYLGSREGRGTTVTVVMKMAPEKAESKRPELMSGKKRVMIVDDEEDFASLIKMNLEETKRYEVLTLYDPQVIMSSLHSFRPDIILLDVRMPGMDGMQVCEKMNEDELGRTTPIIMISALDDEKNILKAYRLGVVGYLTKPIMIEELVSSIEKALCLK